MNFELRRRIEALRAPLMEAAADGFRRLESMPGLGAVLREACDRVLKVARNGEVESVKEFRVALEKWEGMDVDRRAMEVARGLRICRSVAGAPRPVGTGNREPATGNRKPETGQGQGGGLTDPVTVLAGIGPAMAERLAEKGIETVEDLVWVVPRRYDDVRQLKMLGEALAGAQVGERVTLAGKIEASRFNRRGRMRWVDVRLGDPGGAPGKLVVRWFHAHPSMAQRFPKGGVAALSGKLTERDGTAEMANPDVLAVTAPDGTTRRSAAGIIPRYPDVPGVPPGTLRRACAAAIARVGKELPDGVPAAIAERLELGSLAEALAILHAPPDDLPAEQVAELDAGTSRWQRRLAFDELFVLGIAIARRRAERRADRAPACAPVAGLRAKLAAALPFALTGAQQRAIDQLAVDLAGSQPMNRLLQGDVGSGKTAVAFAAAQQAIAAGRQVAWMAPTELLAAQHLATIEPWARRLDIEVALLTASTPRGAAQSIGARLAAGALPLVVGTHALLSESVVMPALGLVVIDEQHRFGVAQRVRLRDKGEASAPHLLVMTATPIPRTLALTAYGDLDVTVLDELPPGRQPVITRVVAGARGRQQTYRRLRERLAAGERAFVVCPLVEAREDSDGPPAADATAVAAELADLLAPAQVELIHGRMAAPERDRAMARFRSGDAAVLVATTVIEVGVDVPEATVMIVEDADRFGLAQLHQLRGRVGRGAGQSFCILLQRGRGGDTAAARLAIMAESQDGFRIAEEDLRLRGPGELLGIRQAGLPKLRFGDLREHTQLLLLARSEADRVIAVDPQLARPEHAGVARALAVRTAGAIKAYGPESG